MDLNGEETSDLKSWAECHDGEYPVTAARILRLIAEVERHREATIRPGGTNPWGVPARATPIGDLRKIAAIGRQFSAPADSPEAWPQSRRPGPEL